MTKQKERINEMMNYFQQYVSFIRKHNYIKQAVRNGRPEDVKNKGFNNLPVYVQKVSITVLPKAPQDSKVLREILIKDVGSHMIEFKNSSTQIDIKLKNTFENGLREYELKIYYTPETPVYDFQN